MRNNFTDLENPYQDEALKQADEKRPKNVTSSDLLQTQQQPKMFSRRTLGNSFGS